MSYFCHKSIGFIKPVEDWWLLLTCDPAVVHYYCWLAKKWGIEIEAGSRHGPHISFVKGEYPKNKKLWFKLKGRSVNFEYSNYVRHNGYHVWLDVNCRELSEIRKELGLKEKPYHSFHFTIGRLKYGLDHASHEPRPKNIRKKNRPVNLKSKY
ncbi:hypothetical protein LCGC14_0478890 [marine sediment metagenome]|uniref:Uncharacterized protein n=1 Tax=marine sediment metagenome TaxID=412755 RepID=A0A0F9SA22_9ZZZZ